MIATVDDKMQCIRRFELSFIIITTSGNSLLGGCVIKILEAHYSVHKSPTLVHIRNNKDTICEYTTLYTYINQHGDVIWL